MNQDIKVERITFDARTVAIIVIFCGSLVATYWHSQSRQNKTDQEIANMKTLFYEAQQDATEERNQLLAQMNDIAKRTNYLITLATFRIDPWTGDMMVSLYDELHKQLDAYDIELDDAGLDIIRKIQHAHEQDLLPPQHIDYSEH